MSKRKKIIYIPGPELIEMMLRAGLGTPKPIVTEPEPEPKPEPNPWRKPRSFVQRLGAHYSHLEMEAALCAWEWVNEVTTLDALAKDPIGVGPINRIREHIGSSALRWMCADEFGPFILKVHDAGVAENPDIWDAWSYDWEIVPAILYTIKEENGRPVLPSVAEALALVKGELKESNKP